MAAKGRRWDIQGLRAVAVLLVVAYHAGLPVVCGFFGVDVFFVISGFVITGVLTSELAETGRLDLARFYRRRVKRLLPALAVMLSVVAALGTLASPVGAARSGGITGIWASVFGANFYLSKLPTGYFDVAATLNPLQHTWTLGVEEQFYLAFPILILVAWRIGRRRSDRTARLAAAAVVALASVFSLELARSAAAGQVIAGIGGAQFAFYASPARAWEFGAGALLALMLPYARRLPLLVGSALGACGLGFLAIGLAPVVNAADYRVDAAVCVAVGTAALIAAGSAPANLFTRLLSRQPLVWIGDLSYSWYLWHWPLIVFARGLAPDRPWAAPVAALVSLVPAWLSYRFVETPIRTNGGIRGRRAVRVAAVCVAVPIAASGGALATDAALAKTNALRDWQRVNRLHADAVRGCDAFVPLGERHSPRCTWRVTASRGTVVLIGDSNAGQFTEPFVRAATGRRYNATVATMSGCPFVDLYVDQGIGSGEETCHRFVVGTLATLVRQQPSLVILAERSDRYIERSDVGVATSRSGVSIHSAAMKAELWVHGLRAVLGRLSRAGIPVVLIHPVPELPADSDASSVLRILLSASPKAVNERLVDRSRSRAVRAEDEAAAGLPGVAVVDFKSRFCNGRQCSSVLGGSFAYRDSTHLSIAGAETLAGRFVSLIGDARPHRSRGTESEREGAAGVDSQVRRHAALEPDRVSRRGGRRHVTGA